MGWAYLDAVRGGGHDSSAYGLALDAHARNCDAWRLLLMLYSQNILLSRSDARVRFLYFIASSRVGHIINTTTSGMSFHLLPSSLFHFWRIA